MEDNEKIIVETEVVDQEFGYKKKTTKQVIHEDYFNMLNGFLNLSALGIERESSVIQLPR